MAAKRFAAPPAAIALFSHPDRQLFEPLAQPPVGVEIGGGAIELDHPPERPLLIPEAAIQLQVAARLHQFDDVPSGGSQPL